jgi:hypothetical protein
MKMKKAHNNERIYMDKRDEIYVAKQNKVNFIAILMLLGSVIAVFYYYVQSVYLGRGYPYNTCFFIPMDRFNDFVHTYNLTVNLNPYFETYFFNSNFIRLPFFLWDMVCLYLYCCLLLYYFILIIFT